MMVKQFLLGLSIATASMMPARAEPHRDEFATAVSVIRDLDRPGRITLAMIWDGNKYVQCRRTADAAIVCEAAGSLMQPSMEHVLTPPRVEALKAMGWQLDPSFGNYIRTFGPTTTAEAIADEVSAALAHGYGADMNAVAVATTEVKREACPPRNGPSQNLAGVISDAPSMAPAAGHACFYRPDGGDGPRKLGPQSTIADLVAVYGPRVTTELRRLRVNRHRHVFVVFSAGIGYIQCEPDDDVPGIYCEAQSADSWPELATVLTPARIERLHAAGFVDPGRGPNYSKTFAADAMSDVALSTEILTLLHDVYGYYGGSKLDVGTERD